MVGVEGVGEAVTGGIIARAVEPEAGEAARAPEGNCLNCGAELIGDYCHRCGQKGHIHRTIGAFWHELVHGVLHFEGKIWRTLPLLAWRPGELTRRYVQGERARFVSPIALFLFSVFLMFAVFTLIGGPFSFEGANRTAADARAEARQDFRREQAEARSTLDRLKAERQRLVQAGRPSAGVDREISQTESALALEEQLFNQALNLITAEERRETEEARQEAAREGRGVPGAPGAPAAVETPDIEAGGRLEVDTGWPWLDRAVRKASENPSLLAYKLQTNAYKFSWALIPISVPFWWLLFLHRRRYRRYKAYDHTVFVTYSIAFMSLGLIVLSLLRPLGLPEGLIGMAITFVPPIHIYRQLRGAYLLSRFGAIWRTFVLLIFAFLAATLFLVLLLALGVLG